MAELNESQRPFSYRLADLPATMRPREQFDRLGPGAVSEAVLLAILLRSGRTGTNVLRLAEDMLIHYRTLGNLARTPVSEILRTWQGKGLGPVKVQVLKAALELGRRLADEAGNPLERVDTPLDAVRLLYPRTHMLDREVFFVLVLDSKNRLKTQPLSVTEGILNASLVHPREVFREAVGWAASAIIVAHNHPSGDPTPSREDIRITGELVQAGRLMGIRLMDHVILGKGRENDPGRYCSLRESGLVHFED